MKTIKIGSIGLGRLGYEHAKNLATAVPGVQLAAVCDIDAARVAQVREELDVPFGYTDFEEMCRNPELDAIAIVSPSDLHVEHIRIAMENGKHVFCEKPLATTVEACQEAEAIVNAHPDLVFMLGFMRRFDKSYLEAKKKVDNGDIGKIILVRSYNQDSVATIESTLKFAPHSGGQFLDMSVHEIDLIRWFTGSEIKNLWGIGGVFAYDLYRELNDGDNVAAMVQCENEAMGFMFLGRAAAHGSHVETEIIGTKGTLRIAAVPASSHLEVMSRHGVCRECYADFLERWHDAYVTEMCCFADYVRGNGKPEITAADGTAVSRIAYRCKESFETGKMLPLFD